MILLNFSHPLTEDQRYEVERLAGEPISRYLAVPAQFDPERPLSPQVAHWVDASGLTLEEWQAGGLLVNLPGHSTLAAAILAHIHGRSGHFPSILRIRPVADATTTRYEVAEILLLQAMRETAREQRTASAERESGENNRI
jgi:hypothetical protein